MKRNIINIFFVCLGIASLQSCIKDEGNYDYEYGNEVTIRYATYSYTVFLEDTTVITPLRTFANPQGDTTDYDHAWYINGEQYSDQPVLKYVGKTIGSASAYYYMIDRKTGIWFPAASAITLNTTSPFLTGWGILYEKNNESELAHIRITNGEYFDYTDLYKTYNNGESMGSQPVKLRDYSVSGGRGMFVIQRGGPGPVELNGTNFTKQLVARDVFTSGPPANFAPTDMAFFPTTDLLVNQDGTLYGRSFASNVLPFTTPWISTPVLVPGGVQASDIWDTWSRNSNFAIMHDKLNNRLLVTKVNTPNNPGGGLPISDFPVTTYPPDYTPLNNLGSWQYVWGGTFNDAANLMDGALILRSPTDNKLYWETFQYIIQTNVTPPDKVTPKTRVLFQGNDYITANSKFAAIKTRNYLFFTGGAENKQLYYYDVLSGVPVTKYTEFSSPITAITAADDGESIAVGLENGTFILFDISNPVIISGTSRELYRLSNLGKVVDIVVKGGKMT